MNKLLSDCGFFGCITPPMDPIYNPDPNIGMVTFANTILKLVIIGAGLFAFINIIVAGYQFLGAEGDVKKVESAWKKIWQSLLGLAFVAGSFVLAAIFGKLLFNDWGAILKPQIYGPTP